MISIAKRITDAERLEKYKALNLSDEEAIELLEYDKAVEHDETTEYDMSPEEARKAKKYAYTGTRKTKEGGSGNKRKENPTKRKFIKMLAAFLAENAEIEISDVQITNKECEVLFRMEDMWYSVSLKYRRNMTKGKDV